MSQPWYREGLKFACTGCGECCTGAPGYVWVNKSEMAALAAAIGIEARRLKQDPVKSLQQYHGEIG